MKSKKAKRLSREDWDGIRSLVEEGKMSITEIARVYQVSRTNIYQYGWRHGWIQKKKKPLLKRLFGGFKK